MASKLLSTRSDGACMVCDAITLLCISYIDVEVKQVQAGKVWLVGAGPGDADLLTIRAVRAIENADLILFDQLVGESIKALFPKAVPAFYVGKVKGNHSIPQKELNALLVKKAKAGLKVCRIKGGDPFIFGRGGEELLELIDAGIDAEIVPGITAASGCSTYAGIPLTHRGMAQGCTFVTAHGESELNLNWSALAGLSHTLVFYMGVSRAGMVEQQLLSNGLSGDTPVAFIENGCRPEQRVITGQLKGLADLALNNNVQSPSLIIVGEVVSLHQRLSPSLSSQAWGQFSEECARLSA